MGTAVSRKCRCCAGFCSLGRCLHGAADRNYRRLFHQLRRAAYDFWNGLPKDVQQDILKACANAEKEFAKVYAEAFDKVKSEQEAAGYKVTVMSDADVAKWASADKLDALQQQWVKEAEAAGLKTAASVLEKMKVIHKQAMARD